MATLATPQNLSEANNLLQRLQELPWALHGSLLVALVGGLLLWAFGRKVVKPTFATLGGVAGAAMGFFLAPATGLHDIAGFPTPYIGLGLGGVVGIAAGVALFRFAMAVSGGLVLAIVGVVGSVVYLGVAAPVEQDEGETPASRVQEGAPADRPEAPGDGTAPPDASPETPKNETPTPPLSDPNEPPGRVEAEIEPAMPEVSARAERLAKTVSERALAFLRELGQELSSRFDAYPAGSRLIISAAGLVGAGIGVLAGLVMPRRSAGAITAMLGAAVWLPSLFWLLQALDAPGHSFLAGLSPGSWAGLWLGASLLGIAIQWSGLVRASSDADDGHDDED